MTPLELKYQTRHTAPYHFTRSNMHFFGDTIKNYGVRNSTMDGIEVWELYRKNPVKYDLQNSIYFRKDNFKGIDGGIK